MSATRGETGRTIIGDLTRDLFEASAAVRGVGERLARAAGQTLPRWQVLYFLAEQNLTVPTVARRLGLTRQAVQRVADELVAADLVRRLSNPDHERSTLYEMTKSGLASLERMNRSAATWHGEVQRALSREDIRKGREFLRSLVRLSDHR